RAERRENGERTFKLVEGEPLDTSYGEDVYRDVFAAEGKSRDSGDAAQTASVNDVPVAAAAPVR
ncbi:MAG TPA: hypothetical protein VMK12_20045, partial [Anaeromyxobacteraceae bacterium]|nr:hypothetical protein [Anaeromyxobacteraceae bacterium]